MLLQVAPLTPAEVADLIDSGNSAGGGSGRHWVLDPIDGTRGFVGMRQYAVCLGMLEQGEVRALGGWSGAVGGTSPTGCWLCVHRLVACHPGQQSCSSCSSPCSSSKHP